MSTASDFSNPLFAKTDWGMLPVKPAQEVIKRRISMIEHFGLKSVLSIPEVLNIKSNFLFEHVEVYSTTENGRVILVSPAIVTDSKVEAYKKLGFKPCSGIWFKDAKSFSISFASVKEYNAFVKSLSSAE